MIRQRDPYQYVLVLFVLTLFVFGGLLMPRVAGATEAEAMTENISLQPSSLPEQPTDLVGAACVIRHGKKMIMVSEVISQKLSIPGGYIDNRDPASVTAQREAKEETGLDVDVVQLLQYRERAAIFACVTKQPILVAERPDNFQRHDVASWHAQHFGSEIKKVYLMSPLVLADGEYRYSGDLEYLYQWMQATPESDVVFFTDLSAHANRLHQAELPVIQAFQAWGKALPEAARTILESLMWLMNLPGEYWFVFLLIVAVASLQGPVAMLQLVAAAVMAILLSTWLKDVLHSPRPFYLIPDLQNGEAYGYGFPSGHTLLATVIWGMLWLRFCATRSWHRAKAGLLFLVVLVLGQAMARVWYGVHFISDTLAAILIGILLLVACSRLITPETIRGKAIWLGITVLTGIAAGMTQLPQHTYLFAVSLGVFLGLDALPKRALNLSVTRHFLVATCLLLGAGGIAYGSMKLANASSVSPIILSLRAVGAFLLALWLVAGSSVLLRLLAEPEPKQ
ncbi:phosphatase PAP2 family protein [Photobacterium sp. CCB-ST2H9]|uniref:bifunctional NUDIX hydrolase/phosphatase PAP2 family protein n=1 Tax=Photobacterium sp. CCB-ST2H9 TaxID=2912855 RepID=UPI002003FCAB|nr:phosphatase PAP2 family protein [Photobacterium sp. CCB-ST2H9]UTM58423.1 phosphatase PAP2 family protein [Photobacterium sp. CCB-ST2H9]